MASVVVYSDQPILAKGIEVLISGDPALRFQQYCPDLPALKQCLANTDPDLALIDLTPDITLGALKELHNPARACKLILWINAISPEFAYQAFTLGVRGILRRTLPLDTQLKCLRHVHSGDVWFEKSMTDTVRAAKRVMLTPRESQLVGLLARGLKNKEISEELGLSEGTVKIYLSALFQKAGVKDRFDLALRGLKNLSTDNTVTEHAGGLRSLIVD